MILQNFLRMPISVLPDQDFHHEINSPNSIQTSIQTKDYTKKIQMTPTRENNNDKTRYI